MIASKMVRALYICEDELGSGAFGRIFKVSRVDSGQVFALKEIDESLYTAKHMSLMGEVDIYPQLCSRHIVNCTQVMRDPEIGYVYLEMEYCNGGTLEEFIMQHRRRNEPITEARIWELLSQIVAGLAYLHSQIKTSSLSVIVHRDIKPANILFSDEEVKLGDFGFCLPLELLLNVKSGGHKKIIGTPAYLAPEIFREQGYSQKIDVWSLGCIILELCILEIPASIAEAPIEPYLRQLSGYSNELKLVIKRCLEKIPFARISSSDLLLVPTIQDTLHEMEFKRYKALSSTIGDSFTPISALSPGKFWSGTQSPRSPRPDGPSHLTALMDAASSGNVEVVRHNIHEARMRTHDGRTALMLAAMNGHIECTDLLLESEAQMYDNNKMTALMLAAKKDMIFKDMALIFKEYKLKDNKGMTALMHAASAGSVKAVQVLIEFEANMRDKSGMMALMHAAKSNRRECVALLAPYERRCHDLLSRTALMHAAVQGSKECVEFLLDLECGLIDKCGETALMLAVRSNQLSVLPLLTQREARLSNVEGLTALMLAVKMNHIECLDFLEAEAGMHAHSGETALLFSIIADNTSCIQRLALMSEEINSRFEVGLTTAMWCILNGKSHYTKWLLSASLNQLDNHKRTALMHAARIGDLNAAMLFIEYERGTQDEDGNTALMYAAEQGHDLLVKHLLEHECKLVNKQLKTALMFGMDKEQHRCCELLAKYEQGYVDIDGKTALIRAVLTGDVALVRLCLEETRQPMPNGKTGLIIAMERGFLKIAEVLGPYEASCRDSNGDTALIWAVKNNKVKYQPFLASAEGLLSIHGQTALKIALELNRKEMFKALLKGEASIKMPGGYTILDCAVLENKPRYVHYITTYMLMEHTLVPMKPRAATIFVNKETALYQGAAANDLEKIKAHLNLAGAACNGWSSLKIAAYYGCEDAVELLLGELGIQVDDGFTALMVAAQQGHLNCAQLLLGEACFKTKEGRTALMVAAHEGNLSIVTLLREFEARQTDLNGNTALHCAAASGHIEILKQLRQELRSTNKLKETSLMYAAEGGYIKCVQYLRAEAGMVDAFGSTALIRALWEGHMGCATILLAEEQGISKVTSLMLAAASGDTEAVKLYIGDASKRDAMGRTALMYAARHGHTACARVIVKYEQGILDLQGYTALAHAIMTKQIDCVELLAREACIPTGSGETVEDLARAQGSSRMVRLLRKKQDRDRKRFTFNQQGL